MTRTPGLRGAREQPTLHAFPFPSGRPPWAFGISPPGEEVRERAGHRDKARDWGLLFWLPTGRRPRAAEADAVALSATGTGWVGRPRRRRMWWLRRDSRRDVRRVCAVATTVKW